MREYSPMAICLYLSKKKEWIPFLVKVKILFMQCTNVQRIRCIMCDVCVSAQPAI